MKNYKNLLKLFFVVLVVGIMLTISGYLLFAKRPTYSDSEKRPLKEMPKLSFVSLLTGSYFSGLQEHYNDTIPNREVYKEFGADILSKRGLPLNKIVIYNPVVIKATEEPDDEDEGTFVPRDITTPVPFEEDTPMPTQGPEGTAGPATEPSGEPVNTDTSEPSGTPVPGGSTDLIVTPLPTGTAGPIVTKTPDPTKTPSPTATKTPSTATSTPKPTSGGNTEPVIVEYPKDGAILYGDRGMELYGGSRSAMKRYVTAIEYIKTRCPDVNVYNMTIPLSSMYYLPAPYKSNITEQLNDLNYLEGLFADGPVTAVRVHDIFKSRIDAGEELYLRTDHHWNYLGVYYAMKTFAQAAGVPFDDLSEYTAKYRDGFVGSFYSYFGMKDLKSKPEGFTYYISSRNVKATYYDPTNFSKRNINSDTDSRNVYFENMKDCYSIALYLDDVICVVNTDAGTGRRLLVIRDSFGRPTPQFLFGSFDKIIMIDPRYYTMDMYDLIASQGITDVLCIANIFDHTGSGFVKQYEYVIQNR